MQAAMGVYPEAPLDHVIVTDVSDTCINGLLGAPGEPEKKIQM